jgi:hypothetical protein
LKHPGKHSSLDQAVAKSIQLFKQRISSIRWDSNLFPRLLFSLISLTLLLTACEPESVSLERLDTPPFRIVFAGDLLLGDAAQPFLSEKGYMWPFEHVSHLIDGDFAIANGEGPITANNEPWDPDQRWSYNAQPQTAQTLSDVGFSAIGLSNNHAMDRGSQGIDESIAHLASNGLVLFGAGVNLVDAQAPLLIETQYGIVAVVALGEYWGWARTADMGQGGTIPLTSSTINEAFRNARDLGAKWVVGFVHWGRNYANVTDEQRRWAAEFAEAGYDLIIGHGSHSIQLLEIIQGMPVFYSIGNFVFGTPGRFTEEFPGFGLVVTSDLGPQGFLSLSIRCIQTDNNIINFQPKPCTPIQSQDVLGSLSDRLIIEDNVALFTWKFRKQTISP